MAKLKEYRTVNLPAMVDPFEQFQKQLSGDVRSYFVKQALGPPSLVGLRCGILLALPCLRRKL